jgi:uncharacterized membrane protein YdjX (TVP38/TMEM64 family)
MVTDAVEAGPPGWYAWAMRPVAPDAWDGLLWASGAVAFIGIVLTTLVPFAPVRDLAVFFSLTLFINGPYSPITPIGFEPILMTFGQIYPPLLVAVVGVIGQLTVEYVNYHLYGAAMQWQPMTRARESRLVRRVTAWFAVQPFLTIVVLALTPLPFWIARIAAPLARYPMRRYLTATAIGRLPRLWFYAALGTVLPFSAGTILGVGLGAAAILAIPMALRDRARARAAAATR